MNSPYMGKFKVTQAYKGTAHDGLDLVGIDSKQIHSTVTGTVIFAGWENAGNHNQGFGQYVSIRKNGSNERYYFGHMSKIYVKAGQTVSITDVIGLEGSTGNSTGSHCHYACRVDGTSTPLNINNISGIPNVEGGIYDDGSGGGTPPSGGGSASGELELSYLKNGSWKSFDDQVVSAMDGIKIQTGADASYYLQYRTWNQGKTDYYPYVKSTINDYAGATGKPVQRLQIQAYDQNGTKLSTGVVVMYRAYIGGKWLPWVSNADPEWMRNVQEKYNLGGTLDTAGSYAGSAGKNVEGIDVRVFEETSSGGGSITDFIGGEIAADMSYMANSTSNWNTFQYSTVAEQMDGIKIQTKSSKSYYLSYQTSNRGMTSFYPMVKSTIDDYAGSAGKPIEKLRIQVIKNDGTKLSSGVIVMYRVYTSGRWLPWVSNADPEWMRSVQSKYSLEGTIDTAGSYAGIEGQSIIGVEVRIFEDDTFNAGSDSFIGKEINLSTQYMVDSNWTSFDKTVTATKIDGVKIQTGSGDSFYLSYQTLNSGQASFYPAVTSKENDYAGAPGKPVQLLRISAYNNDGTKLTNGVVIMYRTLLNGRWLPWVSNADKYSMQSVQNQFNLGGSIDPVSGYAGSDGKNIGGIEIRAFVGESNSNPIEDLPGAEAAPALSYMVDSTWKNFNNSVLATRIDGLKIQTGQSKPYFLRYQTRNSGQSAYYPEVSSTINDYAGSAGKAIQLFKISAYRNDGTKLTTGVVVMYRAYVDGKWLPWVSNADPDWMRSVQAKYDLDGTLDTGGYYAGIEGKNVGGIEVRIFEEKDVVVPPKTPTGDYKIIDAPFICQLGTYPTGCESVSTVMALNYHGFNLSVDAFIDNFLNKTGVLFDPDVSFGGDPRTTSGFGCFAPVIATGVNQYFKDVNPNYTAQILRFKTLKELCDTYIDKNIPVILWATMYMNASRKTGWYYNNKYITWVQPEHCLLLVGYDDEHYIFNDPLQTSALTYYKKDAVETAYKALFSQAVVIGRKLDILYQQPPIPAVKPGTKSITSLFSDIYELENFYKTYYATNVGKDDLTDEMVANGMTNFLRAIEYEGFLWYFTTGHDINNDFINFMKTHSDESIALYGRLDQYIKKDRSDVSDGETGIIDLAHLAATLEAYINDGFLFNLPPIFWAGWGGDLATGMDDTTKRLAQNPDKTLQQVADMTIGDVNSSCNYSDFCCDFDSIKLAAYILAKIKENKDGPLNIHLFTDALKWYYTETKGYKNRFKWIMEEMNCTPETLRDKIGEYMGGPLEVAGLLTIKGKNPSPAVFSACCDSFANYISKMINS